MENRYGTVHEDLAILKQDLRLLTAEANKLRMYVQYMKKHHPNAHVKAALKAGLLTDD